MIRWKIDVLAALRDVGMIPNQMRVNKVFGEATIQNMRGGKPVSWAALDRLCGLLNKQPGDLIEFVDDVSTTK